MTIRYARPTAILLAAAAVGAGATELHANLVARARLAALLGAHEGLSVAGIFAEPFTGRLALYGFEAAAGAARISIGRLELPLPGAGFGLVDDARAETAPTGTASAENVTITSGHTTYRVKRVDMTGTSLSNADLASLVDPKNSEPIEARLKTLNATAIVAPEILADDATAGSERHATLSQVVLSGVVAGKVASGTAGGVSFAAKDGEEETTGKVGAIQAAGVDLPQIARVFGALRTDDAEPLRTLCDTVTATGIDVRNARQNTSVTLASLKEIGAKARPLQSKLLTQSKAEQDARTQSERTAGFDDLTHSFEIGGLEANDLKVRAGAPGETNALDVASVSLRDFAAGKIGSIGLRALAFDGTKVDLGVGAIDMGPFVLPRPKSAATGATDTMLPTSAKAEMRDLKVDVTAQDAEAGTPRARFTIGHTGFTSEGDPNEIPKAAKVTVDNFGFDLPQEPGKAQPLVEMGYRHLDLSALLATRYASGTQELEIKPLALNGTGMGSLGLGLKLANVTAGLISQNQEVSKAAALSVLAKGLSLDLVNDGLVDRAIAWKAKQDGLDVPKEKAFLVDFFSEQLPASLGDSANLKIVGGAIAKFVTEPKTLHIAIVSQSGVGVGSMALLADPGLFIDTLEVKASAND